MLLTQLTLPQLNCVCAPSICTSDMSPNGGDKSYNNRMSRQEVNNAAKLHCNINIFV